MYTREELKIPRKIFLVASEGYAADHLFSWFSKSINKHEDLFSLLAHEGSRPKYFSERTRGERPDIFSYCEFLHDMSMTYGAIGDCYSYRIDHFNDLLKNEIYDIPLLYLRRNPITWLYFYQRWRSSNMRMGTNKSSPLDWEWMTTNHNLFNNLGLKKYGREDVQVWSFYQGLYLLNMFYNQDIDKRIKVLNIEDIFRSKSTYADTICFLTKDNVNLTDDYLELVFQQKESLYAGEEILPNEGLDLVSTWEDWQLVAYRTLLSDQTFKKIQKCGYDIPKIEKKGYPSATIKQTRLNNIFISSLPKSGTHLIREIIEKLTGLSFHEPQESPNITKFHNYDDHSLISIPHNKFFSWHNIITPETSALLLSKQAKPIFIVRNLVEIVFSFINHLRYDIDSEINKSVGNTKSFFSQSKECIIYNTIIGYHDEDFTFTGMSTVINQLLSFYKFKEKYPCLVINYRDLINKKEETIGEIIRYLNLSYDESLIQDICTETDLSNEKYVSNPHVTKDRNHKYKKFLSVFHEGHLNALKYLLHQTSLPNHIILSEIYDDKLIPKQIEILESWMTDL